MYEMSDAVTALTEASGMAEQRDENNRNHIKRVQCFCRLLALELRNESVYETVLTDSYITDLTQAAAFHDIGKIGVPEHILLKHENLEPEEFEIMKLHVEIGKSIILEELKRYRQNELLRRGLEITACHHERWDGSGYPEGMYGQDIPLSARIMALADVYDDLRSKRPYKEPLNHERSVHIIKEGGGLHFDPSIVKAFSRIEAKFEDIFESFKEDDVH